MEKLRFILKENVERFDEDGKILPDKVSTLGYKFEFNGEWHGSYFVINKPSVTAQDVMEILEQLCPSIEQTLKALQADTKSI
jgi:hypothetical protein